jgi:hypothetical protein
MRDCSALPSPARSSRPWLTLASLVLLAYAVMGKGAGYIGAPPVFIGEMLLLCGVASLVFFGRISTPRMPTQLWCLAVFCAWGLARTLPYLSLHGVDALRDAVIWGYAAFAFLWYFYILREPLRLIDILRKYQWFAAIGLVGMALLWTLRFLLANQTPKWPWADVAVIEPKPGDIMVHLAGILAFWISLPTSRVGLPRFCLFSLCVAVMGAYERAALFAFGIVFLLCALFRPKHPIVRRLAILAVLGLAGMAISGIVLEVPVADSAKVREISFNQFAANISSAFSSSDLGDLDDTKEWRLAWWGEIVNYTLHGDYLWTGKGFGVNLADDDGFQVMADHSLRSPHNASLMLLARTGVPGFVLWLSVQLGWAFAIGSALLHSLRAGHTEWSGLFLFLLCYWVAFMINGMFDVFLEGPMGGIWFWSLYGIGLAARRLWIHNPELLKSHANPYSS